MPRDDGPRMQREKRQRDKLTNLANYEVKLSRRNHPRMQVILEGEYLHRANEREINNMEWRDISLKAVNLGNTREMR